MGSTDEKSIPPAVPRAEDQADSSASRPLTHSLTPAQLKALVRYTDPCSHNNDRDLVLRAIYHETDGSDEGLAITNEWSSHADDYPGPDEIARRWHSLKDDTGDPVTVCTLCDMVEDNGFDWTDICSRTEPDFEPCSDISVDPDEQPAGTSPAPPLPLDKFSLKGKREQLLQDAIKQGFALEPLALTGQATAVFGPPNTGKSLIVLRMAAEAVSQGLINPEMLFYLNSDDSQTGILEKLGYADEYGFHTIAEGHQGFSADQLQLVLHELVINNQAKGVIIILDTGKKFYDPMSKREGRKFGKYVRRCVMKGGTVIVLAHTNKHRDKDGKPIYAGTTDVVEDFDCAHLLYEVGVDADTETRTVQFENIKNRGNVARQVAYRYSIAEGLSYREVLDSVEPIDDDEVSSLRQSVELESDAGVIEAITRCIQDGIDIKMRLAEATAKRSGVSKRAVLKIIEKYTGSNPEKHRWNYEVHERGAKKYRLLNPITTGSDHV